MTMLIRLAFVFVMAYLLAKWLRRLLRPGKPSGQTRQFSRSGENRHVDELVQDPVCKIFLAKREAVALTSRGGTVFFCSKQCRDRFVQQQDDAS